MGQSTNICSFDGYAARDAEMSYTPNGKAITKFSLPINFYNPKSTNKGHLDTFWLNCAVWGQQAEFANNYIHKGDMVFVSGTFHPRTFVRQDKTTGVSYDLDVKELRIYGKLDTTGTALKGPGEGSDSLEDLDEHPF
jgi:single-strand DNA-binding protein